MTADKFMMKKLERALAQCGGIFTLEDIRDNLKSGRMQGHVVGDTWAITQVLEWPRSKSVNVVFVVGDMKDALELETVIEKWAKDLGASFITGTGRDGWWDYKTPGWKKMGVLYSKDI
jgi:hypothetical protein